MCAIPSRDGGAGREAARGGHAALPAVQRAQPARPWLRGPARQRHPFLGLFRDYVVSAWSAIPSPTGRSTTCLPHRRLPAGAMPCSSTTCWPTSNGARAAGMAGSTTGRPARRRGTAALGCRLVHSGQNFSLREARGRRSRAA
jgi:hypothetical protein